MLLPSHIALFVLATVQPVGKGHEGSMYSTRIEQIQNTWGGYFPHLYFVMGRNFYDYEFLRDNCAQFPIQSLKTQEFISEKTDQSAGWTTATTDNIVTSRKLVARTKQIPLMHTIEGYLCPILNKSSTLW